MAHTLLDLVHLAAKHGVAIEITPNRSINLRKGVYMNSKMFAPTEVIEMVNMGRSEVIDHDFDESLKEILSYKTPKQDAST